MHLNVEATHPKHNSFPGRFIQCNHLFSASAQKKKKKKSDNIPRLTGLYGTRRQRLPFPPISKYACTSCDLALNITMLAPYLSFFSPFYRICGLRKYNVKFF